MLLDENVDRRLRKTFDTRHEVLTVVACGWSGTENGELLDLAQQNFDVFVTTDKGIPHQQNLASFDLAVILLQARSNSIEDLAPLMTQVNAALDKARPGELIRLPQDRRHP